MRRYATPYIFGYALLIITLFMLSVYSFEGYSIAKNTLGELGAQRVPGSWFANITVIILSSSIILLATRQLRPYWQQLIILYFFCISFLLTGVYQSAGLDAHNYIYNYTEDALHSLFSIITGFAFCLFCVFFIFIIEEKVHIWQTFSAFSLALIVPLLMWLFPEYRGIFQRILFLGVFGWLFYALTAYQFKIKNNSYRIMKRYK